MKLEMSDKEEEIQNQKIILGMFGIFIFLLFSMVVCFLLWHIWLQLKSIDAHLYESTITTLQR